MSKNTHGVVGNAYIVMPYWIHRQSYSVRLVQFSLVWFGLVSFRFVFSLV